MGDTVIITAMASDTPMSGDIRTPSRRSKGPKSSHPGAALIGVVVAGLLLVLGGPRLVAALSALDAGDVVWDVLTPHEVPVADLARANVGLATSRRWVRDSTADADHGLLLLHQAMATPPGPERSRLLKESEGATTAALTNGPGQSAVWLRLAWLRKTGGDTAGAVEALRLSWLSAAFMPSIMVSRLKFALSLLPSMSPEMLSLLRRQFRLTWVIAPDVVSEMSNRPGLASLVRDALTDLNEEEVAQYVRLHGQRQ